VALTSGTRIGPYQIVSPLGAGGMGEVYRARDTRLGRDIALKILPEQVASDPDRVARFTREAQTLAALNHPNIAHIHGLEESGGVRTLIMELVEGEDLAQRLAHGSISLDEALSIARQIADALEAAHEQASSTAIPSAEASPIRNRRATCKTVITSDRCTQIGEQPLFGGCHRVSLITSMDDRGRGGPPDKVRAAQ
jgi:serine/threonine protein kinase